MSSLDRNSCICTYIKESVQSNTSQTIQHVNTFGQSQLMLSFHVYTFDVQVI